MDSGCQKKFNDLTATAIIQARIDSQRLPGKALIELAGKPMLAHVIERAQSIRGVKNVVLATCCEDENRELIDLADKMGIHTFIGSKSNVLERFFLASEKFPAEYIVRITGDNPFTDPYYASQTLETAHAASADLCAPDNLPLGVGVGVVKKCALDRAYKESSEPHHFEHVTPYIKENPQLFSILFFQTLISTYGLHPRLTVDTLEDYELASAIYDSLYKGEIFSLQDVISLIKEDPTLHEINAHIEQRTMLHSTYAR